MTRLSDDKLLAKLQANTQIDAATGCHNWTAYIAHGGYGQICTGGRGQKERAHRVAYQLAKGPIPDGLVLDHLCRNRRCCNPDHLEAVTQQTNVLRGEGPAAIAASRTHCPQGHPYDDANSYIPTSGFRHCRACMAERQKGHWARQSAGINARRRAKAAALKLSADIAVVPQAANTSASLSDGGKD